MKVGDLLEWCAAGCFVAGAYLGTHRAWVALLASGVCLAYFGQCHAQQAIPKPRLRRPRLRVSERVMAWFAKGAS